MHKSQHLIFSNWRNRSRRLLDINNTKKSIKLLVNYTVHFVADFWMFIWICFNLVVSYCCFFLLPNTFFYYDFFIIAPNACVLNETAQLNGISQIHERMKERKSKATAINEIKVKIQWTQSVIFLLSEEKFTSLFKRKRKIKNKIHPTK